MTMHQKASVVFFRLISGIALCMALGCGEAGEGKKAVGDTGPGTIVATPEVKKDTPMPEYMVAGEKIYNRNCLVCHQVTGSGVPGLNPPLKQTEFVTGDIDRLLGIILNGSNVGLVVNGSTYANAMPAFQSLSDEDIAHVSSYIRNNFGNSATEITPSQVAAYRSKK